ncbi:MAG: hypothetical protein OXF79_04805 [Chloroflexi bacterium]|nr:hypothetical protein [Chloroflexota bacterium]
MDREAVSEIVRHSLDEVFANLRRESAGAGEWTKEVKTQLCLAGAAQQPKLHVRAEGVEAADDGEWLHDLCWLRYGEAPQADPWLDCLNEVVLIVECEWGEAGTDPGRIRDDFQKLMVGRARVRCMIWEDDKGPADPTVVERLFGMMSDCVETAADDLYLLARYTAQGFQYWHLCGNGTVYPM